MINALKWVQKHEWKVINELGSHQSDVRPMEFEEILENAIQLFARIMNFNKSLSSY